MKNLIRYFILVLTLNNTIHADWFSFWPFETKKETSSESQIIIASGSQEKQHQLNSLKKEKENLENTEKEFSESIQTEINLINQKITDIKQKLQDQVETSFLNKILSKLNEIYQLLLDSQLLRKKVVENIDQNIEILETYLKDPYFKNIRLETKTAYKFETLYKVSKDISKYEEELKCLNEEKVAIESNIEVNKKDFSIIEKDIKSKEKERKKGIKSSSGNDLISIVEQKGELLDLDIRLGNAKKLYTDLKIKELSNRLSLLNTRIFISESILKVLKSDLITIENSLWISELDIESYEDELNSKKRESIELQSNYSQNIKRLSQEKEQLTKEFDVLSKKYNIHITDLNELSLWSINPNSLNSEIGLYELGYIYDRIQAIEREIELKETLRDLEREKIESEEFLIKVLISWHKITQHKFKSEDEINNEIKEYEDFKIDTNRTITTFKDKINIITNLLNNQIRAINNLKEKIRLLNEQEESFTKKFGKDNFKKVQQLLEKVEEQKNIQTDFNNRLIEAYSNLINLKKNSLKQLDVIIEKLERTVGILQRSEYAISWSNVKNIIPDISLFLIDLKNVILSSLSKTSIKNIYLKFKLFILNFYLVLKFLLILLLVFLFYFVLRKILLVLYPGFLSIRPSNKILHFFNSLVALIVGFAAFNLLSIYIWSLIYILIRFKYITDLGFRVIFYLISIPYLCFIVNKFAKFLIDFNVKNNFSILSSSFQKRFVNVFQFILYSTIIIFFFRDAFLLITYGKSELPIILLAFYSIILRSGLIFLIGKEEVLSFIPSGTTFWNWVRSKIDKYYYLILIAIIGLIIISDPYIGGFSKLVSFVLQGIVYTALLLVVLWWLQILLKKISSAAFFKLDEEEIAHERFLYAKTFYSIFTIVALLFIIAVVLFIVAKIWDLPVSLDKVYDAFNVTIFNVQGNLGELIPISLKSFLTIFIFAFGGLFAAWAFERFILRRIFDILLVEQGIQNTIANISYYLIVIVVLLVGFLRVGFGGLIPYFVGALAVGLAFAIKEPANDFIGYFILVVERSLKIGDYIEIDPNTKGVVRSINARSVVLRRNNSVSIVVPNSKVINTAFFNWNYARGFIAFDDIFLTVSFSVDPEKVSKLLFQVLDENSNILKSPHPVIRLNDFSENGYVFLVRGFLSSHNVGNMWDIASGVRFGIVKKLRENGIEISSPVRRVVLSSGEEMLSFKTKNNLQND